jgi:hypothetical protein
MLGPRFFARDAPWRHVGIVIETGSHHAITWLQGAGYGSGESKRQRRHVGAEHHTLWVGIKQLGHYTAGAFEQIVGGIGGGESTMSVGVVATR